MLTELVSLCALVSLGAGQPGPEAVLDKTVVLTFDDAVQSHVDFVAPLLKEYGFGATFFITHAWMPDQDHFLSWEDAKRLHDMGFEIGNHSWTHGSFNTPKEAARLEGELTLVDNALEKAGVPKPVSFGWTGNAFGPEALKVLEQHGIRFARRGMQPEFPYGQICLGPLYEPGTHHPLLIPTCGDAYPEWTLEHFRKVVDRAGEGQIAVVQFHGVPDPAHPWVHTPPERFKEYMAYLKKGGFRVIALRDVAPYVPAEPPLHDPMLAARYPEVEGALPLPTEVEQTRANLDFWLENMLVDHGYSLEEAAQVCEMTPDEVKAKAGALGLPGSEPQAGEVLRVRPYPGGRHPRIGFHDGAVSPQRGTKISIFSPWDPREYVVYDAPEAIWSNLGLTFLAHTHVETIWDQQNAVIENVDWQPGADGSWTREQTLPNGIRFWTTVTPRKGHAEVTYGLENGTDQPLSDLRSQCCLMLSRMEDFNRLSNDDKILLGSYAAAKSGSGDNRWIVIYFEGADRPWANPDVPCIHVDPKFRDLAPGEHAELKARVAFVETEDIEKDLAE